MASEKQYAYYIEGNQISIVERDLTFDNNVESKEFGPGVSRRMWKSPITAVTDGLELKYTYSPKYTEYAKPNLNVNKFYVNGWTSRNGYLCFVRAEFAVGETDWTQAPYTAVTSGTAGDTGGQTLDYIAVKGSSRWNGVHKVVGLSADGLLITDTRVPPDIFYENVDVDFNTDEEMFDGAGTDNLHLANDFSTGDYVFISGTGANELNTGLFYISGTTSSNLDTSSKVQLGSRYVVGSEDNTNTHAYASSEYEDSAGIAAVAGLTTVNLYRAHRDFCHILTDVNVLNDENDKIDLPSYLTKGLVYYVKARLAEDEGNIDMKEYFMREYKKILERHESGKIGGVRIIGPGSHAIR